MIAEPNEMHERLNNAATMTIKVVIIAKQGSQTARTRT